jgi:broad specificity phosphatase PhoE
VIIHLVRHGETTHNRDGLGLGRADVPLTELGERQAESTAARFADMEVDEVYSSPLVRAHYTAKLIAEATGAPLTVDERLVELAVGETEGLPFAVMRERYEEVLKRWSGPDGHRVRLPGGESIEDISERVTDFMNSLEENDSGQIVVVSHNFVLRVFLCQMIGLSIADFRKLTVDLSSISTVDWTPERTFVRNINDRCHLSDLDS